MKKRPEDWIDCFSPPKRKGRGMNIPPSQVENAEVGLESNGLSSKVKNSTANLSNESDGVNIKVWSTTTKGEGCLNFESITCVKNGCLNFDPTTCVRKGCINDDPATSVELAVSFREEQVIEFNESLSVNSLDRKHRIWRKSISDASPDLVSGGDVAVQDMQQPNDKESTLGEIRNRTLQLPKLDRNAFLNIVQKLDPILEENTTSKTDNDNKNANKGIPDTRFVTSRKKRSQLIAGLDSDDDPASDSEDNKSSDEAQGNDDTTFSLVECHESDSDEDKEKIKDAELWDMRNDVLLNYKNKHGNLNVVAMDQVKEQLLVLFVSEQQENQSKGLLSLKLIKRLNELDFPWDQSYIDWDRSYNNLVDFFKCNGHCNDDRFKEWIDRQRQAWADEKLTRDRITTLSRIGLISGSDFKTDKTQAIKQTTPPPTSLQTPQLMLPPQKLSPLLS